MRPLAPCFLGGCKDSWNGAIWVAQLELLAWYMHQSKTFEKKNKTFDLGFYFASWNLLDQKKKNNNRPEMTMILKPICWDIKRGNDIL